MTLPTTIYSFPAYLPRFSSTDKPAKLKFHQYARATLLSIVEEIIIAMADVLLRSTN